MDEPSPVTLELVEGLVWGDDPEPRRLFLGRHKKDARAAARAIWRAYNDFEQRHAEWEHEERAMSVALFLHAAANSILAAARLLVSGYPVPSGNMMRQHAEAVAMAMLIADPDNNAFDLYRKDKKRYPYRKALDRVSETKTAASLKRLLHLDKDAWRQFKELMEFYHAHSHISAVALGFYMHFGRKGRAVLGSGYDPHKHSFYQSDIRRIRSAAENLRVLVQAIDHVMPKAATS